MANQNILTYNAKVAQSEQTYFAPIALVDGQPISTIYCFLSQVDPWPNEITPTVPTQDQAYLKKVFKSMFVAKQVTSNQISPVTQRINWNTGVTYDYYQDNVDMFALDSSGSLIKKFYVKNKYDQVFKCLWNYNGAPSTNEPYFQPGSYGTDNIFQSSDGYKWKYMYTIDTGTKQLFLDDTWMPVPVGANTPNPVQTNAGYGDLEAINVISPGSGYDPANTVVTVSITGDGTGASATPVISNGQITDVIVTNPGSNYSIATVSIVSSNTSMGSGAVVVAPTSPIGGHSFDPVSELGCNHVMITCQFSGSESLNGIDYVPTDIDYRQVGLIVNPFAYAGNTATIADGPIYKVCTELVVSSGFKQFVSDEIFYQGASLATATFTGTVLSFNTSTNVIKVINTTGTYTVNAPVFGVSSGTIRTLFSVSTPTFIPFSGYLSYIENRAGVQRSSDGIEQFKFVLGF